ncbi:nucleotidyltransferase family protein [Phenylobacterium sp.]|uniref:nucleotidyltransferase family protein n=1 Tax=Phenylobacterium sp. TaxID=1871053 RepID=UPI002C8DC4C0|nr:nucleotidyltransferase family protein [Phenylobacterium sp.]HVI30570.1 nucleotidyltransferase family protein [Phenylobacterium sp.]
MGRLEALRQLSGALRGRPARRTDWRAVLGMANEALVTPQLHVALRGAGALDRLPPDLRAFTEEVFVRNRERNRRLFSQLHHAVAALNAAGIAPVLLKGAALWASLGRPQHFDRMLRDLDLLVEPAEQVLAVEALAAAGFRVLARYDEPWRHVAAELGRADDVGVIDLHRRPPGPLRMAGFPQARRPAEWDGVFALAPEPAAQVVMLAIHDQLHEGGYWRGDLPLRHLFDIAALAPHVDWVSVEQLAGARLTLRAVAVQVAAAHSFAGLARDWPAAASLAVRLQHLRQLVQLASPPMVRPLAWVAALSEAANLLGRDRLVGDGPGGWVDRLARFRTIARPAAAGPA